MSDPTPEKLALQKRVMQFFVAIDETLSSESPDFTKNNMEQRKQEFDNLLQQVRANATDNFKRRRHFELEAWYKPNQYKEGERLNELAAILERMADSVWAHDKDWKAAKADKPKAHPTVLHQKHMAEHRPAEPAKRKAPPPPPRARG